jgi:hypothetical protein
VKSISGLTNPNIKARLTELTTVPLVLTPEQFGSQMAAEIERWGKVVSSLALSRTEFWGIGVMSAIEGHRVVAEGSVRVISDTEQNARHAVSLRPESERRALSTRFCRFGKIQSCGLQWSNRSFAVLFPLIIEHWRLSPRASGSMKGAQSAMIASCLEWQASYCSIEIRFSALLLI